MQKDRMQIRQNTKRQFTNMTKHKSDNTQYDKTQMRQNTKSSALRVAVRFAALRFSIVTPLY